MKKSVTIILALLSIAACKKNNGDSTPNSWFELKDGVNEINVPAGKKLFTFIVNTPATYETEPFYVVEPDPSYHMRTDKKWMIEDCENFKYRDLSSDPEVEEKWIAGTAEDNRLDTLERFTKKLENIQVFIRHAEHQSIGGERQDTIFRVLAAFDKIKGNIDATCRPSTKTPADVDGDGRLSIVIYSFRNNCLPVHWNPKDYLGITTDRGVADAGHPHDMICLNLEEYHRKGWRKKFTMNPQTVMLNALIEEYYRLLYYDFRHSDGGLGAKGVVMANSRPMLARGAAAYAGCHFNQNSVSLLMNTTSDEYMFQKRSKTPGGVHPHLGYKPFSASAHVESAAYYGDGCFFHSWLDWKYPDKRVLFNLMKITDEKSFETVLGIKFSNLYFNYLKEMISVQHGIGIDGASGNCPFNSLGQIICPISVNKSTFVSKTDLLPGEYQYCIWDDEKISSISISLPAGYKAYAIYANDIL